MKAAFIGLGIMGKRMASNLLKNNVSLRVYNRTADPAQELAGNGAVATESPAACVHDADVVFTMLSTPEVVEELAFGRGGFVSRMNSNSLWIDCSTVDPGFSRSASKRAKASGIRFMDAPVAGSKAPAENGELVFLVGAVDDDLNETKYLLEFMGKKIIHAGVVSMGTTLKMLVNGLLAQSMLAFAETVLLGEKAGLSRDLLLDLLPNMPVSAPFTKMKAEKIRDNDYEVEFPLEWMHKDLQLLSKVAYDKNSPQYMANLAKEIYAGARARGLGREDFSAIYKFLDDKITKAL